MKKIAKAMILFTILSIRPMFGLEHDDRLCKASKENNLDEMQRLIESGVNADQLDRNGNTPLVLAINRDNLEAAKLLIANGANVNITLPFGDTLLNEVASDGNLELTELLLESGANVNKQDTQGRTPLHIAATGAVPFGSNKRNDPEYLKSVISRQKIAALLIKYGAEIDKINHQHLTPLHQAAKGLNQGKIAELLLSNGANPNAKDEEGRTPLHLTSCEDTVEMLLKGGANIYQLDNRGWTPLFYYFVHDYICKPALVRALYCGADINKEVKESMTLLDIALDECTDRVIERLKNFGAITFKDIKNH